MAKIAVLFDFLIQSRKSISFTFFGCNYVSAKVLEALAFFLIFYDFFYFLPNASSTRQRNGNLIAIYKQNQK